MIESFKMKTKIENNKDNEYTIKMLSNVIEINRGFQ